MGVPWAIHGGGASKVGPRLHHLYPSIIYEVVGLGFYLCACIQLATPGSSTHTLQRFLAFQVCQI